MTVRTRYAPSPTGALHIGNVRSGLFAYLFARHQGGKFILRIDDTDQERSTKESLDEIIESLRWLGVEWDEGPPDPAYFQSHRFERYRAGALELLRAEKAYPCYCTAQELDAMRKQAEREHRKPGYDGRCRERTPLADLARIELPDRTAGRNYTIRFRSPREGETVVDDLIKGRAVFANAELDDLIIFRSDGIPTYNFATVLDDADLKMTHVVRGDDHLPNTPRQIQIFYALGLTPPEYAHLPMVMGPDGQKLSKRHGATSVFAYRDLGYFPEALLNYLVRLGWSHGDQEIFSKQEMIEYFDFASCGKSAGIFNAEKLLWLNFHYLKERPLDQLAHEVKPFIAQRGWKIPGDDAWLQKMIATLRERAKTLVELVEFASFYLNDKITIDPKAAAKFLKPEIAPALEALATELDAITDDFAEPSIQTAFERVLARFNLKLGQLAQPVRVALTGGTVSPGIYEVIAVLGRTRTVTRLRSALASFVGTSRNSTDRGQSELSARKTHHATPQDSHQPMPRADISETDNARRMAMAKKFGGRWEIIQQLSTKGGQADVFLVKDLQGVFLESCALKRIRSPKRRERFLAEVQAGTGLKHENIMPILDHSDLEKVDGDNPMYIVMPFAAAGSLEKRAKLYEGSLDSTVKVAKALANALGHAHGATPAVVHRDLKPANILFLTEDHNPLISDFGICLIEDRMRVTESGEVVGPWAFMAPEVEGGGQLEVGPAADLYSLGKVIYFMISGGVTLPRETHRQPPYDLHARGGGYELLWLLLDQLICPLDRRMTRANDVIKRLETIENWGRERAVLLPASASASLSRMVEADLERQGQFDRNNAIRERREAEFRDVSESVRTWLVDRMRIQAEQLERPGFVEISLTSEIPAKKLPREWQTAFGRELFQPVWAVDLGFRRPKSAPVRDHCLTFILARKLEITIQVAVGGLLPVVPVQDKPAEVRLIPVYFQTQDFCGFLSRPQTTRQIPGRSGTSFVQAAQVRRGFYGEQATIFLNVDLGRWPADVERYEQLITDSIGVFLEYIEAGGSVLGQ